MPQPIRLAFLGLGQHAHVLAHAAHANSHIRIEACCSLYSSDSEAFAADFQCRVLSSVESICADSSIDAVVIATPNDLHAHQSISLAQSGKHLFVEKPICNSIIECDEIIQACQTARVLLAVGHQERRNTVFRKIKSMIDNGFLGKIHAFDVHHCGNLIKHWGPDDWRFQSEHGTGPILHKGIHKIDILNYLFGRAEAVSTVSNPLAFNQAMDETAITAVRYANGIVGSLSSGFRYNNQSFNLYAEHYSLNYSGYGNTINLKHENTWEPSQISCDTVDIIYEELDEFAQAIQGTGTIEVDGNAAREAILFATAATESAAQKIPLYLNEVLEACCA